MATITIGKLIAKPALPLGEQDLTLIKATHDSENGRIAMLFGSNEYDGIASASVMPSELNWILPIWLSKMPEVTVDTSLKFDDESSMREHIVNAINACKGDIFSVIVEEADVEPLNGKQLFNAQLA